MNVEDQIAKLQKLLRRVLARTSEPRTNGVAHENQDMAGLAEIPAALSPQAPTEHAPVPEAEATQQTLESRSRLVSAPFALEDEGLDEMSQDDVTHGISPTPRALDSSARRLEITGITESDDLRDEDLLDDEHEAGMAAGNEIEEPAPSSSRRPIASEAPEPDEESEDSSPRHTPPPESGKQVAATPVLEREFTPTPEVTSVRRASVPAPLPASAPALAPSASLPAPAARLASEVSRATIAPSTSVASMVSAAPAVKVTTFGDLLDATLGL